MYRIRVLSVGKVRQSFVVEGVAEYAKRLAPFAKLEMAELNSDRYASLPEVELKKKEGELLLEALKEREQLIVLDSGGKQMTSEAFARWIETKGAENALCFAIGGAYGWSTEVKERASMLFSLSSLTFTYQMSKLLLVEQLYRALSIIRGAPYHK